MSSRFPGDQVQLACEYRRRKVNCDKLSPCSNCERHGVQCIAVRRARLPRGRTNNRATGQTDTSKSAIMERMDKIEQQLIQMATVDSTISDDLLVHEREPDSEFSPLRCHSCQFTVGKEHPRYGKSYPETKLSPQICRHLCAIYLHNVDPLFKILHRPSVQKFLCDGERYLDYEPDHHTPATLASAIFYSAACSLNDSQCVSLFSEEKRVIVALLRKETESALFKADCTASNDLTILQAYVLSLTCLDDVEHRSPHGPSPSLHLPEPPFPNTPFDQEMRRRLWLAIGLLDISTSLSHASEPMMQLAWLESHPPSNVNDDDIWFDMEKPVQEGDDTVLSDMSFSLILFAAQNVVRSIGFSGWIEIVIDHLVLRQRLVDCFRKTVPTLLLGCSPEMEPFQWYARLTTRTINSWLQLISVRPLKRSRTFVSPAISGDDVLRWAAKNLQTILEGHNDPRASPWRWFECMWTPWHGLAVAMSELCACENPLTMAKYWPLVEGFYCESRTSANGGQSDRVSKPMDRLFAQARARKEKLSEDHGTRGLSTYFANDVLSGESGSRKPEGQFFSSPSLGVDLNSNPDQQIPFGNNILSFSNFPILWPNIWDQMEFGNPALDNERGIAYQSYEDFMLGFQNEK
ncbi:hypothetical protein N7509_000451 [Penicillium cosmopolitanum]|uniref:Zn(2)-C6 fungal-type domain-containing protein n=1 Tax=Penicillium cosmopolitanum TaxID=1131564 RepID=A0A9X0BE80_9EURO|nr:uncharacterized protein N7509_000451 [Penicillium cosmopolitanum]KAJ5413824.1 hypothetical protein N7509_000451 [Penicillium cosmopolitanum]